MKLPILPKLPNRSTEDASENVQECHEGTRGLDPNFKNIYLPYQKPTNEDQIGP